MNVKIGETETEKKILFAINEDWLALRREEPIDPTMPIIDPHHHLWDRGSRYLLDELKRDIDTSGHNICASVFVQCDSMYRADGDPKFVPIGETEFVNGIAGHERQWHLRAGPPLRGHCRLRQPPPRRRGRCRAGGAPARCG